MGMCLVEASPTLAALVCPVLACACKRDAVLRAGGIWQQFPHSENMLSSILLLDLFMSRCDVRTATIFFPARGNQPEDKNQPSRWERKKKKKERKSFVSCWPMISQHPTGSGLLFRCSGGTWGPTWEASKDPAQKYLPKELCLLSLLRLCLHLTGTKLPAGQAGAMLCLPCPEHVVLLMLLHHPEPQFPCP